MSMFSLHSHAAILAHSQWGFQLSSPRLPVLQYYFQSLMRLSFLTDSITSLTSQKLDWIYIKYLDLPKLPVFHSSQTDLTPTQWQAHSCPSSILLFLNTCYLPITSLNFSFFQGQPSSTLFMKIGYVHSGPPQLMIPSLSIYSVMSNNFASNDIF